MGAESFDINLRAMFSKLSQALLVMVDAAKHQQREVRVSGSVTTKAE